jgi:HAD superfamily hydrolase (TIGR01509 family)
MSQPSPNSKIMMSSGSSQVPPPVEIDWDAVDVVFLDMDGTLLDLHFDNHFWLEHVPRRYAEAQGIELAAAKSQLKRRYRDIQGTLEWYCVDHWSRELGLDIALLKAEVEHLIAIHPFVIEFLDALAARGKRRVLVTNAHQASISLKLERTQLGGHLERVICAHDIELPKESPAFWGRVQPFEPFDPKRTLFIDDNLAVLRSARDYGFRWLLAISEPDSKRPARQVEEFPAVARFSALIPHLRG